MLQQWIKTAQKDKPVWLDDVSRECSADASCVPVVFVLTLFGGELRAYTRFFPRWNSEPERRFVSEYLDACVYNMLSALGGSRLSIYYDTSDAELDGLVRGLGTSFQLDGENRRGYGKVINEAERICALLGKGRFSLEYRDISEYVPAAETPHRRDSRLADKLRRTAGLIDEKVCCGIDVGGTDIKLAVSARGKLVCVKEYDWNPAEFENAQELTEPVMLLARLMRACAAEYLHCGRLGGELLAALEKDAGDDMMSEAAANAEQRLGDKADVLDSIGLSFPDVVIRNAIVGGETPKTQGMRRRHEHDYESEFARISALNKQLEGLCRGQGRVRATNDGNIAAYTAAMELAHGERAELIENGVLAHALGTDLGTGWVDASGEIPELVLEMYDTIQDLGSWPSRGMSADDLRCVRNENSGLAGARRYMGQAGVFRMAYALAPDMLDGFVEQNGGLLRIISEPHDMRKPCLEHIMALAEQGRGEAEEVFRQVGRNLAHVSGEMSFLLSPETDIRFLFGRFVKRRRCFELICEGFAECISGITLIAADNDLACTGLMRQLAGMDGVTVAQFGQAIGAVYFGQS